MNSQITLLRRDLKSLGAMQASAGGRKEGSEYLDRMSIRGLISE